MRKLTDQEIVLLYWQRCEEAIVQTETKYGRMCRIIAANILRDGCDAEEVVNDCWWKVWNSVPPQWPDRLSAFVSRITRNLALSRLKHRNAQKRGGGEVEVALEELGECLSGGVSPQRKMELRELTESIDGFLSKLDETTRNVFLGRYWYFASISDIAACSGFRESKVKNLLFRTRKKLLNYLQEEGLC